MNVIYKTEMREDTLYSTSIAAKEAGVTIKQLYYWEQLGIVKPHYEQFGLRRFRRYDQQSIETLRRIKTLLDEGFTLRAAVKRIKNG